MLLFCVTFAYYVALIASVACLALKMSVPSFEVIGEKGSSVIICFCLCLRFLDLRVRSSLDPELFRWLNVLCEFLFELNLLLTAILMFVVEATYSKLFGSSFLRSFSRAI